MNEVLAAEAARLRVAADAAVRRVALAAPSPGPDRNDRQTTFRPESDRIVRAPAETATRRDTLPDTPPAPLRRGASPLYLAQQIAQEQLSETTPRAPHAHGTAQYPSMSFDDDILLPGEAMVRADGLPRLDLVV